MVGLATLALAREAAAFEVKHAATGELVRWHHTSVVFAIDPSVAKVPGANDAIAAAVSAWSDRAGAPTLSAEPSAATIEPGFDGKSTIFYSPSGFAPAAGLLAVTILSFDDRTGEVLDADIVLNGEFPIGRADGEGRADGNEPAGDKGVFDVGRIVAHEMGHALGLSDERALKSALMFPYVARDTVLATSPASDDLQGIDELYAKAKAEDGSASSSDAAEPAGCTGATVARTGTGSARAPGLAAFAAGLAIAALALGRGRRRGARSAATCTALAAVGLFFVPPAAAPAAASVVAPVAVRGDEEAVVASVKTTASHGLFRSEIELTSATNATGAARSHVVVWGGTLGGVRQVIGGIPVPNVGERLSVAARR